MILTCLLKIINVTGTGQREKASKMWMRKLRKTELRLCFRDEHDEMHLFLMYISSQRDSRRNL